LGHKLGHKVRPASSSPCYVRVSRSSSTPAASTILGSTDVRLSSRTPLFTFRF